MVVIVQRQWVREGRTAAEETDGERRALVSARRSGESMIVFFWLFLWFLVWRWEEGSVCSRPKGDVCCCAAGAGRVGVTRGF